MISDLAMWVQCFSVYMAVVTAKEPARTKNLLAYQAVIAKCSQNSNGHHVWSTIKTSSRREQRQGLKTCQRWNQANTHNALPGLPSTRKAGADSAILLTIHQRLVLQSPFQRVIRIGWCNRHYSSPNYTHIHPTI